MVHLRGLQVRAGARREFEAEARRSFAGRKVRGWTRGSQGDAEADAEAVVWVALTSETVSPLNLTVQWPQP